MKSNYKIIPTGDGKFQLEVDKQIIKLCRTDIVMETNNRDLLEKIAEELDPGLYRLEDGDLYDQYIPFYFILSKVLMASMDKNHGPFSDEHFHWMISSDPFFHLVAGPESIDQRESIEFGMLQLEKAGGTYSDLPQIMASNAEQMEGYRQNPLFFIDLETAGIIRKHFLLLDTVKKGLFFHLWASTRWNVWIPLLWLNELCTDEEFCQGVAATQALIPAFSDVSDDSYKEIIVTDLQLLKDCRDFIQHC